MKLVYCVYSLELPQWGDSIENTQFTFMLKKIVQISIFCLLTWRYDEHSQKKLDSKDINALKSDGSIFTKAVDKANILNQ